ncbi:hypothetical protein DTO207G8_3847 [Paecilomyces variotii]|nr:hypothetical protein DTO207G8_3847 [Paecilomyces variotii]KAJ9264518.1 hypothetical protein DTO195F2_2335 [Paecilomyces variotii]KAJ9358932.1 hypothetical protein DTO027B9_2227 [Paecilomyces variotii]KAJ9370351.1 hypothetical protein DTO282E5_4892 [Paecilomyces variotii]
MPPLPSLPSAVSFLRGVAPRSQSAAGQLLPTARRGAPSAWYTHESRPFTFSDRSCSVSLRGLSQSQSQAWNRCAGRLFSSSTRQAPSYQYKRFQPGRIPYPGQQGGGGGGGGPPWWAIYRNELVIGVGIGGAFYLYNLETVEMTGRRRFNCVSTAQELKMGEQSYREVMQQYRGRILPDNHPLTIMVAQVMKRLIPQAPIEGADWKVHVIHDDSNMNAFVLPGGKVFVFTGIMPICRDEDGLAAVLGHEIAHVVARHPAERMSNSFITIGLAFVVAALFDVSGQIPSMLLNLIYGLPNSRTQEAEADTIGLMMMSKACFNPEAAVKLWGRMQKAEKGSPPQFMSTHPSSYNRMEALSEKLPKAEAEYEASGCSVPSRYMPGFRQAYNTYDAYGTDDGHDSYFW